MKTEEKNSRMLAKIYRDKDIQKVQEKMNMLGSFQKMDTYTFLNVRLISSIVVFLLLLYFFQYGYLLAPFLTILYYYLFTYVYIDVPLKKRTKQLDHDALYFFEILTLTLESGRDLEHSLEVTVENVDTELSREFKQALYEMKFGKSLIESLEDMKKRIPSETVNNIILNMTQTSVFGNSILETMYHQIDFLRDKQILEIRGTINKIPNKVSIISVVFVVPLILLMILGPFIINLLS